MKTEITKGFRDYTGEEAEKREAIRKVVVETFEKYGFEPAETPVVEYEEFVKGENSNDEAVSDIFKLKDKGKRNLALRYEFTFQLKRIAKNKKLPYRRYQIGPVFRDEPVSANRVRQFIQCDVDVVGSDVRDEAEVLGLANELLRELGIAPIILINNRKLLNEILDDLKIKEKDKTQVLREIDKLECSCKFNEKDVVGDLKKLGAEKVLKIIKDKEKCKKYKAYSEIKELEKYCKLYGVKLVFTPSLVRGLSYYNGNIFEIKAEGLRETIVGGGSYIIDDVQATGISFGLERLEKISKVKNEKETYLVISLEQDKEAIKLAQKLREQGKVCSIYYGKPSKAMEFANSKGIDKVIFVGKKEVVSGKFKVKDMKSGGERLLRV